jgi:preprotein translocase subunit SecE
MKKIKLKPKPGVKPQENDSKEVSKKPNKNQVVKLGAKKGRLFSVTKVMEYWGQIKQFLSEAIIELKKVTWPGRKETIGATAVVIVLVIIISTFLGIVDLGLTKIVNNIIR